MKLSDEILNDAVEGVNLQGSTLREQLRGRPTLLVFLRHFGCLFCREIVSDLRKLSKEDREFPPVLFFFNDTRDAAEKFFAEFWPEAHAVVDNRRRFYDAFGLSRGTLLSVIFDPRIWKRGIEALGKRNAVGIPRGDTLTLPGFFLVDDDQIVASYRSRYSADHPDLRCFTSVNDNL